MGSPPNGGSGTITRMDILQNAASLFINKLDAFKSDDDAVALTYFESTIDNPPPAFGSALTNINGNAANFIGDITAQSPGSATAMGDGLLAGKNKLSLAASGSKKFIFLFTDGEQNVGKQVNAAGTMAGPDPLNDAENSIQIVTIGTGGAAMGNPMTLLQHIAESNTPTGLTPRYFALQEEVDPTGNGNDFNAATAISNFFDEGFQSMLSGSSPQTVAVEQGIMPAGMPESKSFEINANINRILFELITSDQEPSMSIEKDGVPITEANTSLKYIYGPNNGTNSLLAVINLSDSLASGITSKGIWKVNLQSGTDGGKPYQIKAQVDDHRLDHTFELTADDFKVEDILNINTKVSYDNIPLEDANVSVLFFKPGEDLGDLLA